MIYDTANRLLLQFHITGRCNLRCKHCYRTEGDVETLSYKDVVNVIEQFKILRLQYNKVNQIKKKAHVNITGGEPFFRKDIKEILKYLGENKAYFSYGILSNGSFIDDETIKILKETEVSFIQLSIDGNREMHDSLRAKGDYDRVLKTARYLEKNGAAKVILESELSGEKLAEEIESVLKNPEELSAMRRCSEKIGIKDACSTIYNCVKKLI